MGHRNTSLRLVTPLLRVTDGLGVSPATALALMEEGKPALVANDTIAREVLAHLGMPECCIDDRISVSHGGPILCGEGDLHPVLI